MVKMRRTAVSGRAFILDSITTVRKFEKQFPLLESPLKLTESPLESPQDSPKSQNEATFLLENAETSPTHYVPG
jgi:hypothetical protein